MKSPASFGIMASVAGEIGSFFNEMSEQDSLSGFDVSQFINQLDARAIAGARLDSVFGVLDLPATHLTEAEADELAKKRLEMVVQSFSPEKPLEDLKKLDIREKGRVYKENFDRWKEETIHDPNASPDDIMLAQTTTLEDLAVVAEAEHMRLARLLGGAVPNSPQWHGYNRQVNRWEMQVIFVRAASEIRD